RLEYMPRTGRKTIKTYNREVSSYTYPTIYTDHDGRAYIISAPTDSHVLCAMDAATGEIAWQLRRDTGPIPGARALVGVRNGLAIVAGDATDRRASGRNLFLVDVASGRVQAATAVTPPGQANTLSLAGRPSLTDGTLLWPGVAPGNRCSITEFNLDTLRAERA